MRRLIAAALVLAALGLTGCYGQSDGANDADKFCRDHGGVLDLNYSTWSESASWVCRDGAAGGGS